MLLAVIGPSPPRGVSLFYFFPFFLVTSTSFGVRITWVNQPLALSLFHFFLAWVSSRILAPGSARGCFLVGLGLAGKVIVPGTLPVYGTKWQDGPYISQAMLTRVGLLRKILFFKKPRE